MAEGHSHTAFEEVTCREFVELVTDYWDDALPEGRLELVEEHLVMCDWCKTYLDQMRATVEETSTTAEPEPVPPDTEEALLAAFHDWRGQS
jgi:predicted anti-sigma-YlaC factor YlaD